jgi:hypothetical protein
MSGRFASLHAGLLLRERPRMPPPPRVDIVQGSSAVLPFPAATPPSPTPKPAEPARSTRRRAFTVRLDEAHHALLQIAKLRFGLSGQRLLLMALEKLVGAGGR